MHTQAFPHLHNITKAISASENIYSTDYDYIRVGIFSFGILFRRRNIKKNYFYVNVW